MCAIAAAGLNPEGRPRFFLARLLCPPPLVIKFRCSHAWKEMHYYYCVCMKSMSLSMYNMYHTLFFSVYLQGENLNRVVVWTTIGHSSWVPLHSCIAAITKQLWVDIGLISCHIDLECRSQLFHVQPTFVSRCSAFGFSQPPSIDSAVLLQVVMLCHSSCTCTYGVDLC